MVSYFRIVTNPLFARKMPILKNLFGMMSDERILGDSEFVESVLSQAAEKYDRHYELRRRGYDLNRIAERAAEIYGMEPGEILSKGKQQRKVQARSLFCFWAVRELGMSLRDIARRLELSSPVVGFL